ncbi:hypothetical protein BCR35DRAFT_315496 [Leucosporidium creatinivorum]|uniref:Uncharacterized protein n=1 Tax=Leucosporidium creatinivorum TaxID=106004 RepID=A0A1Y2DZT2_9BASI|nr:hypothetical protein BCR35DRAFT_315496 [Leucosporidium creatinivorum]
MFARFSALSTLAVVATLASTASALNILGLVNLSPNILQPGNKLINLNVLADVLSPLQCSGSAVVGVDAQVSLLNVLNVCACVEAINTPKQKTVCPACPAHATAICAGQGQCGCQCDSGYYSAIVNGKETCVAGTSCASPNTLIALSNGKSQCVCARGFVDDLLGGCISACLVV